MVLGIVACLLLEIEINKSSNWEVLIVLNVFAAIAYRSERHIVHGSLHVSGARLLVARIIRV